MKKEIKQIVILNGGDGKRVKKITKDKPKCLLIFDNKSFLQLQIELLKKKGFNDFLILTKDKNELIKNELKKIDNSKIRIKILSEKKKLGTGGAIKNSYSRLKKNFAVIYGDSWLDFDYKEAKFKFFKNNKKSLITAISKKKVKHKPNLLIKGNKIHAYSKKKYFGQNYIDYGFQIFKKDIFKKIDKTVFDLNFVLNNLIKKDEITTFFVKKRFYEIGSLKGIKEFKKYLKKDKKNG